MIDPVCSMLMGYAPDASVSILIPRTALAGKLGCQKTASAKEMDHRLGEDAGVWEHEQYSYVLRTNLQAKNYMLLKRR